MLRIALVAAFVPAATAALAAAWTLPKGQTQAFVVSSFTYGDHGFDRDGNLITVPEYRKFELTGTVEYGVRPWLTAIGRAELKQETAQEWVPAAPGIIFDPTYSGQWVDTTEAFGSVGGGARVRLHQGQFGATGTVASVEATAFSGGMDAAGTGSDGDGPGLDARVLFGASRTVLGKPVFGDLQLGFRKRFRADENDEVKIDATLGANLTPKWMVLVQSFTTIAVDDDTRYTKLGGSVVREVTPKLKVELGAYRTVAGADALVETGGRLGFWWTF